MSARWLKQHEYPATIAWEADATTGWNVPVGSGSDGRWYFSDETWTDACGPFATRDEAVTELAAYARTL